MARQRLRRFITLVTVVVLGTGWVPAVAMAATTALPAGETRLAGPDRFGTSAEISRRSFTDPVDAVYIATGRSFADALAGGPAAARAEAPILLVETDSIPEPVATELDRLEAETIIILGGTAAVSAQVEQQLHEHAETVIRLSGADRYQTATAVSRHSGAAGGTVFLASGASFPDGLAGGAAAAHVDGTLLLTRPDYLPSTTAEELTRLAPAKVYVLGGPAAVSGDVTFQVRDTIPDARIDWLSGNNRYDTSVDVARSIWTQGSPAMFVATGTDYADALSGTPAAQVNQAPLILTRPGCLPSRAFQLRNQWAPATTAILGGTAAINPTALATDCGPEPITSTRGYTCTPDGDCRWPDGSIVPNSERCGTICGEPPTSGEVQTAHMCQDGTLPPEDCEGVDVEAILAWTRSG